MLISRSAAKRKMWKLKSFGSLRNINKTGNKSGRVMEQHLLFMSVFPPQFAPSCSFDLCFLCNNQDFSVLTFPSCRFFSVVLNSFSFALPFSDYGFITLIVLIHNISCLCCTRKSDLCLFRFPFLFSLQRKRTQTLSWCRSPGRRGTSRPRAWRTGTRG